jgi:glycosyltransferase involved in cell wall biosynthesis
MSSPEWIIVTARNEADRIEATIGALREAFPRAALVVADDHSTDATAQIAAGRGAEVVTAARSVGKGGAATRGARRVLAQVSDEQALVLLCDADLGHSAALLAPLVDVVARGDGELAVADFTRREGGGFGLAQGFARRAVRRRAGLELNAPISGQRVLRAGTLRGALPFARGYGLENAMTIDVARAGGRVVEVPLDLQHRASGRTLAGFAHRGRQLADFVAVYVMRR